MSTAAVATEVTQKPKKPAKQVDRDLRPDFTFAEIVVATIAASLSGVATAFSAIRSEFNDIARNMPGIGVTRGEQGKIIDKGLIKEFQALYDKCDFKFSEVKNPTLHAAEKGALKKLRNKEYISVLHNRYGIVTEGVHEGAGWIQYAKDAFNGTVQRYKHLDVADKKTAIWGKSLSIMAVVGVSAYSLLTGIATRNKAKVIEDMLVDKLVSMPSASERVANPSATAAATSMQVPSTTVRSVQREETLAPAAVGQSL